MSNLLKKNVGTLAVASLFLMPLVAFAQSTPRTFSGLVYMLISFINPMAAILVSLALLIFFWGIVQYIYSGGSEGHEHGRQLMVWGIVALFVLVSIWGLARILTTTFFGGSATMGTTGVPSSSLTPPNRDYLNSVY